MASVLEAETGSWREGLRNFHVGGSGLEHAMPAGPLRPAVLDRLELPAPEYPPALAEGRPVSFAADSLLPLHAAAIAAKRAAPRAALRGRIWQAAAQMRNLLALDDSHFPGGASPQSLAASLGAEGDAFFDANLLARALDRPAGGLRPMPAPRRARIAAALETLERALDQAARAPAAWLFFGGEAPALPDIECRREPDSFAAALEFCDAQLDRFAEVLRALRIARLENESAYDAAIHDSPLSRFDWQSADAEELAALPAIIVMEPVERLARMSLTSFGRLLRSGRPVQVLVTSAGLVSDDLSGSVPDFGYLAIAHREAFVLQSSMARPDHLAAGLAEMARTLRPAVAVVSVPRAPGVWFESLLLYQSRAFPLYSYDPDHGESWSERFRLDVPFGEGETVTAAEAAAVSGEFQAHFRVIPESAWDAEQIELGEYLEQYRKQPPLAIPYLWVANGDGSRGRAVLTRELVNLCRDRARAWRILEELAGVRNTYVESAVTRVREESEAREKAATEQARLEAATQVIYRLVTVLTGSEPPAPAQLSQLAVALPAAPPAAAAATASAPREPQPAAPAEPEPAAVDPYIDSFLCTSCNDCMKVNALVFLYDENKQAYIGDARAGTFAELVKAAEGCPAKCIHPGTPRAGDKTATPDLIARGQKLG